MAEALREIRNSPTFRLFKNRNAFISGFTAMVDRRDGMSNYNGDPTNNKADFNALMSDWKAVGGDMRRALNKHGNL